MRLKIDANEDDDEDDKKLMVRKDALGTVIVKEVRKRRTVRVCRPTDRPDVYAHVGQHGALHEPEVRFAL